MKSWKSRIVLSILVVVQSAVMLALLAMYVLAPPRVPFPLIFLVAMTALLVSAAMLAWLSR